MYDYDFAMDMEEQNAILRKRNKQKLNELLDKYGGSREVINQHADLKDSMEYLFSHGDKLIDEVLEERRLAQGSQEEQNPLKISDGDISQRDKDKFLKDMDALNLTAQQRENLKKLSLSAQISLIRDLKEERDKVKNSTNMDNHKEIGGYSLEIAKKAGQYKESLKFDKLISSIFYEEGGYEDRPNKIDQPTNMGIIQSTLDNFNKAHPNLRINKKLKDISKADAQLIYKLDYYDKYRLEEIDNEIVARTIFHMFVNSSPTNMALIIQKSINNLGEKIDIDGTMGSITLRAINKLNNIGKSEELNKKLIELRLKYEDDLNNHQMYPGRRRRFQKLLRK